MHKDLINFSGKIIPQTELTERDSLLLGADFIYQRMHVMENKPLHVEGHNEIVIRALLSLYGNSYKLSSEKLANEIKLLVEANRYDNCSVIVNLYVLPPKKGHRDEVNWIMTHSKQLLYKGYVLWHKPLKAIITHYEYPFAAFPTAVALAAHNYARGYAERQEADLTLTQNHKRIITGAGPYPFFAVSRDRVFTTPLEDGALDSVVRRLGIKSCEAAGFKVVEQPIYAEDTESIDGFEEFFIVTNQGVSSIGSLSDKPYPTSAARVIAEKMATLTDHTLLMDEMFVK